MNDQAERLRSMMNQTDVAGGIGPARKATRVITITSGKGGVGKSNFTLNFAIALQKRGHQVLIFDADIGLANIDLLMGITPQYNLYHLLKKEKSVWDIIHTGYSGVRFIAGGSGFTDLLRLTESELDYFTEQVGLLNGEVDYILFDTGAGLSKETLRFILAAHETIVVTTPEPTSLTDAYAIIKMVNNQESGLPFRLVVNRVSDEREGRQTAEKITLAAKRFLQLDIPVLGYVADDSSVSKAVKRQVPFTVAFPHSGATRNIEQLADQFLGSLRMGNSIQTGGVKGFLSKMMRLMK